MDPEDADQVPEARPPLLEDLLSLCRDLNREQACYVVIGGMAIIQVRNRSGHEARYTR